MSEQDRKSEFRKLGEGIATVILTALLIFAFAALIHHASSTCPEARNPATQQCR